MPRPAEAAQTYRIGSYVLVTGDQADRVKALLGKPLRISRGIHRGRWPRQASHRSSSRSSPRRSRQARAAQTQRVERWHYRYEGRHLIVSIAGGHVVDIVAER